MAKLISYAQNFEDIMLWRALKHVREGFYVDVGAQSPEVDSVSRLFHELGWHGVHIDPVPEYASQLRKARPGDVVLQAAVGAQAGTMCFYAIADSGLSTGKQEIAARHAKAGFETHATVVPCVTLDDVFSQIAVADIHWLKIDVEGAEADVLMGWSKSAVRPWVIVIESTQPLTQAETFHEWESGLLSRGYAFVYFDGINRFYVSDAHPELAKAFSVPPNIFDGFSLSSSSEFCASINVQYHELQQVLESERVGHAEGTASLQAHHAEATALLQSDIAQLSTEYERAKEELRELHEEHENLVVARDGLEALLLAEKGETVRVSAQLASTVARMDQAAEFHRTQLAEQLEASREQQRLFDTRLQSADERQARLLEEMASSAERMRMLDGRLLAAQEKEHQLLLQLQGEQLQQLQLRDVHRQELARLKAHIAWVESEWEASRRDVARVETQTTELRASAHHWWLEAERLRADLASMTGSRSWRVTAPLRSTRRMIDGTWRGVIRFMKSAARPLVLAAMGQVLKRPGLRRAALGRLNARPGLRDRLRSLALYERLISDTPLPAPSMPPAASTHRIVRRKAALSPGAEAVLGDLHNAIKEGGR